MSRKVVVIPTFNERDNITRLIPLLWSVDDGLEIVVVDDNSPDGTGDAVKDLGHGDHRLHLLRRRGREGIGPAYKEGLHRALVLGADLVVQMDADFSHSPMALPEFFAGMAEYDVVLGSRYVNGITVVNWPIGRLIISYFGNWYVRKVTGMPTRDTTGGFKCWRRQALEAINLHAVRSNGYAFQIEMTYRAWKKGFRIKEIPIIFVDRTAGESKMTKRIGLEALWIVWWLRLRAAARKL